MGELLQLHLEEHACDVTLARDGRTGLHLALSEPYDLIVLDLMLPEMDGLEVCRRVRGQPTYVPIQVVPFALNELVMDLPQKFGPEAEQRSITLTAEAPKDAPLVPATSACWNVCWRA